MVSAVAAIGGALIGAKASSRASKRAVRGQKRALAASEAAAARARTDVTGLFRKGAEARKLGFDRSLDFSSGAPEKQIAPFQRGNILAQEQVSRGLPQIQSAILGQPVDLSGFQARSVGAPSSFNFDLSGFRDPAPDPNAPQQMTPEVLEFLRRRARFDGGTERPFRRTF